jgi:hypothetical protein
VTLLLVAHDPCRDPRTCAMMYSSSQGGYEMIDTCVLHDDYEDFAKKFLGVDYEDYIGLQLGLPDEDEIEIEYSLSV